MIERVPGPGSSTTTPKHHSLDWWAITRGSLVGLVASLMFYGVIAGFRHSFTGFRGSGAETAVSLLALACYFVGGNVAVGTRYERAITAGAVSGVAVACLGQVISFAILVQRNHGPWLQGPGREHPQIALLGPLVFGALFGALGGAWAKRRRSPA
jgi:hypothetical protein